MWLNFLIKSRDSGLWDQRQLNKYKKNPTMPHWINCTLSMRLTQYLLHTLISHRITCNRLCFQQIAPTAVFPCCRKSECRPPMLKERHISLSCLKRELTEIYVMIFRLIWSNKSLWSYNSTIIVKWDYNSLDNNKMSQNLTPTLIVLVLITKTLK